MFNDVDYKNEREKIKTTFNSDTMCTAKFLSSTIYLQTGQTHSCYHPLPHDIPIEEIKENPSALHNTQHKIERRQQMMKGERPEECNYCWRVEDMGEDHLSDRIIKSKNELLMTPTAYEDILKNGWNHNYIPTYLEISFGSECNMKCAYCHPKASSAWMKEMDTHGQFPKAPQLQKLWEQIYPEDKNPYLQAFWDWWPMLRTKLKVLRLTGGEPLLQQSIWKFLDMIDEKPCPDLVFQMNSNLNVKNVLVKRFCAKIKKLIDEKKIKRFHLFTSLESWGPRASYTRSGLDLKLFEQNMETVWTNLKDYPRDSFSGVTIMNTFNIMSVTSYVEFLQKILEWRKKFTGDKNHHFIKFDIPHCTEPAQWTLIGLPDNYDMYFRLITDFINKNSWDSVVKTLRNVTNYEDHYYLYFSEEECIAWSRVNSYWNNIKSDRSKVDSPVYLDVVNVDDARRNWFLFIEETDKRRGTNFLEIFPEMEDYYKLCSELESLDSRFYNKYVKEIMISPTHCDIHLDDDFFLHHTVLGENLLNLRYVNGHPTKIYRDDLLIREF
jgi:hypothetical protein